MKNYIANVDIHNNVEIDVIFVLRMSTSTTLSFRFHLIFILF